MLACTCAGPRHRTPDLRLPARYETAPGQTRLMPVELDRWWLLFNDAELTLLETEALAASPDAKTAASRLIEAGATRAATVAGTLPQGQIQGTASHQSATNLGGNNNSLFPIGGTTDTLAANFNVSWELDLFGRLALQRREASADLAATRFDVEATRASLTANVADSLFQARGLAIQLQDATTNAKIEGDLETLAARKAEVGLGARSDADRVAGDLAIARSQVEDFTAQLHAARRQLLILIGRGVEPTASLPADPVAADPPPIPDAVPGELLARRPDVREADFHLRSQAAKGKLAHLAVFPTFTLMPGLGVSHVTSPGVAFIPPATLIPQQQTTSLGTWTIGGAVSQPVLDIPRLIYSARAEDARTEQAVIAYEKIVQTAYGEAEIALGELAADERRVAILTAGEARARRAFEAARQRYADGIDELTPALSAEQAWRTTRATLTAERVQALRRAVQTYKALGGGWASATAAGAKR
jgi:NodT family efflux transporter outer membrane factor (OMF) lipoprotein